MDTTDAVSKDGMRRLRPACAASMILMLLAGLSGTVVAQDGDEVAPAVVTGTEVCSVVKPADMVRTMEPPVLTFQGRDQILDCHETTSDPRVSGIFRNILNWDCYQASGTYTQICAYWGTHALEGDSGWDCSYAGTSDHWNDNWLQVFSVCPGTGEYEGLTYVMHHVYGGSETTGDMGDGTSIHGIIYEGPPPPWGPRAEAAE